MAYFHLLYIVYIEIEMDFFPILKSIPILTYPILTYRIDI